MSSVLCYSTAADAAIQQTASGCLQGEFHCLPKGWGWLPRSLFASGGVRDIPVPTWIHSRFQLLTPKSARQQLPPGLSVSLRCGVLSMQ